MFLISRLRIPKDTFHHYLFHSCCTKLLLFFLPFSFPQDLWSHPSWPTSSVLIQTSQSRASQQYSMKSAFFFWNEARIVLSRDKIYFEIKDLCWLRENFFFLICWQLLHYLFCDQQDIYVPLTKSPFKCAGIRVSLFFSMLPSTLKYLYSVEPVRMHFPSKQPCTNDTVCNAA